MDKFLGAFSLQNFLRQFFCGVVFFVPFFLYETPLMAWLERGQSNGDWSSAKVTALGVLACIIGTIIYHLEKNIYSYGLQCVFEFAARCKTIKTIFFCILFVVEACVVCVTFNDILSEDINCFFVSNFHINIFSSKCFLLGAVFIFPFPLKVVPFVLFAPYSTIILPIGMVATMVIIICYLSNHANRELLRMRTRKLWVAEGFRPSKDKKNGILTYLRNRNSDKESVPLSAIPLIAERIAKWSDFIHCVQSCCFAWMSGCLLVMQCGVTFDKMYASLMFAVALLILEIFFDWHRYQHVLAITERNNKNT